MAGKLPSYRRHSSGRARVTINGKDVMLGPYGSPESKAEYARIIAEIASGASSLVGKSDKAITVNDGVLAWMERCKVHYGGEKASEFVNMRLAMRPVCEAFGETQLASMGTREFKAVRVIWCSDKKRSRPYINKQMARLLRFFKWCVGEQLLPADSYMACKCIDPLKRGRCEQGETEPILPVQDAVVEQTLPHCTSVLAVMIRTHRLLACRPGEVVRICPQHIQRNHPDGVWRIVLPEHKGAWRGNSRTIYAGPKAQEIMLPYLLRPADKPLFSPKESEAERRAKLTAERVTPPSCGNTVGSNRKEKPAKEPRDGYDTGSYRHAVWYACDAGEIDRWSPGQIRHTAATSVRQSYGLEAAQVILGHAAADVTQIYALRDEALAVEIIKKIG